jgi:hypothetical protein
MAPETNTNGQTVLKALAATESSATSATNSVDGSAGHTVHGDEKVIEVAPTKHPLDDATMEEQETLSPEQKSKKGVAAHVTKLKSIEGCSITKVATSML